MALKSDSSKLRIKRNIVFFGETGAGKSSAINLLLGTGATAPVSNDSHLCTRVSTSYETMLNGTKYNLWDTRGLGGARGFFHAFLGTFFGLGGSSEKELKKFLKERHANHEIDLFVYCVRGSRASKALLKYYNDFCVITRRFAAPVVIVVTHLEKEKNMEDWWCRNSADLKKLEMEFDDHVCITTLPEHHRRAESKKKLVDLVTKDRRWEAKESGSYFGSPVQKSIPASPRKRGPLDLRKVTGRASVGDESISRHPSSSSGSSGCAPSTTSSSYYTAGSPTESMLPSPIVEPPTPRCATTSVKVPHINTNLLRAGDRPQSSEESSSSMADSSMFHPSSHSSYTSHSEVYLESCTEENEDHFSELPFRPSTSTVRRRQSWASRNGAFGDVWECDLISGHSSRMVAVKAVKTNVDGNGDMRGYEKVTLESPISWNGMDRSFRLPISEIPERIENLGEITTQKHRPAARGGVWFRTFAEYGQPVVPQWIPILLPGEKPGIGIPETPFAWGYCSWSAISQGVIHGDLHSGNILIDDDGTACIADFGLSFISDFLGTAYLKSSICGVVHFADPALVQRAYSLQDNVIYPTGPCDIYSFGGVMLHVLTGKKPYDGISPQKIFPTVLHGERPQIPNKVITPWHKKLILRCWDHDESKRPSADGLVRMFDRQ